MNDHYKEKTGQYIKDNMKIDNLFRNQKNYTKQRENLFYNDDDVESNKNIHVISLHPFHTQEHQEIIPDEYIIIHCTDNKKDMDPICKEEIHETNSEMDYYLIENDKRFIKSYCYS